MEVVKVQVLPRAHLRRVFELQESLYVSYQAEDAEGVADYGSCKK